MTRIWGIICCVALLAGCLHQGGGSSTSTARQEIWPAPSTAKADLPSPTPASEPRTLDPAIVQLAKRDIVMQVRQTLEDEDYAQARELAEANLPRASATNKGRLHWLAAQAALKQGDTATALGHLRTLSDMGHPLARWAQLEHATLIERSAPSVAVQLSAPLTDDWAGQRRARLVEAGALVRIGDIDGAIQRYRTLVDETSAKYGAASAGMPLARLLEQKGDPASRSEALALYERVVSKAPLTQVGREAQERYDALSSSMPNASSSTERLRAATQRELAKAEGYYAAKRFKPAERAFARALKQMKTGSEAWCDARYKQGRSMLQLRERSEGAPVMVEVADECPNYADRPWARFHAARAYSRIGQWDSAIAQYEKLEAEAPKHRLADDAAFRAALVELERDDLKAGMQRLANVPRRYPDGDMWSEALFRLGWMSFRNGDYDSAFGYFDELAQRGGDAREEGVTGRAFYWRARALYAMGRRLDAVDQYVEIAQRWPLRYYAQQALARLGEIVPERAEQLVSKMREPDPTRIVFAWRPEFDAPAFDRAIELLAVGEITYASAEMYALQMLGEDLDPELAVVGAILLQYAGAEVRLDRAIREHFEDFEGLMPKGEGRLIWEVAYPKAFSPLIEKTAEREALPASFVRAVAREESSFNPEAVSWAQAYGLVQLIMPTAKRFAEEVGVRATPYTLKKPDVNLKIGARYMAWLWERFQENPALVPSAYNAGEGAVRRWLEQDSSRPLDIFVEEIPFDETRRYTRRVLQTYGVYEWLSTEELPPLHSKVPEPQLPQRYSAL